MTRQSSHGNQDLRWPGSPSAVAKQSQSEFDDQNQTARTKFSLPSTHELYFGMPKAIQINIYLTEHQNDLRVCESCSQKLPQSSIRCDDRFVSRQTTKLLVRQTLGQPAQQTIEQCEQFADRNRINHWPFSK